VVRAGGERNDLIRFETIPPFLRPIARLLMDSTISEIMINPGSAVFERAGQCEPVTGIRLSENQLKDRRGDDRPAPGREVSY
jgi:hypothetical protein